MAEYKIRELCGDWALDIPMGNDIVVLYFNSRVNAEMVKNVLEWENAHPNEAVPYNTPTIEPASLRPHGEWVVLTIDNYFDCAIFGCSQCKTATGILRPTWKFCPHCGARMED